MSQRAPENLVDELLATSEAMLSCAEKSDWENVAKLDIERRNLFTTLLENPADEIAHLSQEVKTIFSINKEVIDLASEARTEAAKEQQTFTTNRQGTNAYLETQTNHPNP